MSYQTQIGLLQLLGILSLDKFLENIWEQMPYIACAAVKDLLAEILTQDQFEILITNSGVGLSIIDGHVAHPVICDKRDSVRLALVYDAYHRGCTLLQTGLQLRWLSIANICRKIENELISRNIPLTEAVGANAYLTPTGSQGLDIHYDNHCAFILQLHGRKHWTVFSPIEELPILRCEKAISRDQLSEPVLETDIVAGDVLYIPRGFPHFASTGDRSSLHLTLSLRTMTWSEVVNALCLTNAAFRQSVRLSAGCTLPAQEHFERELIPQLASLDVNGFLQHRLMESLAALSPLPTGRLGAIDEAAAVGADTVVQRASLVSCIASEEDGEAVLRFPGETIRLPAAMKLVFDFVAKNKEFTASELPLIDAIYDAEELTRVFIRKGLVRPKTDNLDIGCGTKEEA